VKGLLLSESRVQPLVVVFEDLHWIDGETQAVLERLIESLPTAPMLMLVNYRPEYQHLWGSKTYYRQLRLDALPTASAEELLEALLGSDPSLASLKRLLITRTEGNPFFLEESVRTLIETKVLAGESGAHRLTRAPESLQIPPTAQAILAARIDRLLPEDKRLLQAAAVVGKDVPIALLHVTADDPDVSLHEGLARLQAAEFLYEAQLYPEAEYTFKHALTHEIAYAGMTNDRRRALHAKIVGALESRHADRVGEHITNLAAHCLRAEMWDKAVEYLRDAAERASFRAANREAVRQLEEALGAVGRLPQTTAVSERTFELKVMLAAALHPLADQQARGRILRDAESIAQSLGDERRLAETWGTIAQHLWVVGTSVDDAFAQGQKALEVAERLDDIQVQIRVNHFLGGICLSQGSYAEAERAERNALGLLQGRVDTITRGWPGFPAALSRSWLAWALAERGKFQEGEQVGREGLSIARTLNHTYSALQATVGLSIMLTVKGAFTEAIELLEEGRQTAIDRGMALWIPTCSGYLGYCYAHSGLTSQALRLLADLPAMRVLQSQWLIHRGEAYLFNGRLHEAKADARDALSVSRERGERGYEAYALCLAGRISSYPDRPDVETAEREYRSAIALAEPRGMRPLIAHCHLGFGKLYRRTGKREQATEHLTTATTMYREMGMTYWLEQAEAARNT
jgi:tetratricopeptide (TPR) repeat protein